MGRINGVLPDLGLTFDKLLGAGDHGRAIRSTRHVGS